MNYPNYAHDLKSNLQWSAMIWWQDMTYADADTQGMGFTADNIDANIKEKSNTNKFQIV